MTGTPNYITPAGYRRLREIAYLDLPIIDYPLPEIRARLEQNAGGSWRPN